MYMRRWLRLSRARRSPANGQDEAHSEAVAGADPHSFRFAELECCLDHSAHKESKGFCG